MASNLYFVDDQCFITPTAGTKAGSMPKAQHVAATNSTIEGNLATFWGGSGNQINRTVTAFANTTQQSYFFGRFSTKPLAAQTIPAQTWTYNIIVGQSASSGNTYIWPVIYVWRPSNNSNVGFILNAAANVGTEWPNTVGAVSTAAAGGAAVTCQDGDILVVECWAVASQQTGVANTNTWRVTSDVSYVTSPYTVLFLAETALYPQSTTPSTVPTAGTKATNLPKALNVNTSGSGTEHALTTTTSHAPINYPVTSQASLTQQSAYYGRYSTLPLAAQTIPTQTWSWELSVGQANANAHIYHWPVLYVWRPSNNTVVGYIFDANANVGVEWRVNADPLLSQKLSGASVTTQEGDILVLEIWSVATQTATTAYNTYFWLIAQNSRIVSPYVIQFYTPPRIADLSKTEAPDTLTSDVDEICLANLSKTEGADTLVADGTVQVPIIANLSKTEGADTIAADTSVISNQLAYTFTENFDNPVIDTGKWTVTQVNGTVGFNSGVGEFTATPGNTNRSLIVSVPNLDFRGGRVFHKLIQPLRLSTDPNTTELAFTIEGPPTNRLDWTVYSNGGLSIIKFTSGAWAGVKDVATNIWANLATYTWIAFRETAGTVYFETAPATASNPPIETDWVVQHSVAVAAQPVNLASAKIQFQYYSSGVGGTVTQTHKVDALNTATTAVVEIIADLLKTETPDTLLANDTDVLISVTLTKTEAPDTLLANDTDVIIGATLTKTEAPDTLLANDTDVSVTASLSRTEQPDTLLANDTDVIVGTTLSIIEQPDTIVADGVVTAGATINASLNITEAGDLVSIDATETPLSNCDLNKIEVADSLTASASLLIGASLTITEIGDSLSAAVKGTVTGNSSSSESDTLVASVSIAIRADLGKTEAPDTVVGSATSVIGASLNVIEGADTLLASAGTPSVDGIIFETSLDSYTNAGAFGIKTTTTRTFSIVKGTSPVVEGEYTATASNTPYVLTSLVDLGGPSVISRTNGIQTDMDTAPLGGMLGNHKLYIGAGAGVRSPFQGRLYQLIMRGALSNAAQVADIEDYTAMKTGVDMPIISTVEIQPGVIRRLNRHPRWYQFSPPPWIMVVLVSICISILLAGCAMAVNDKETDFHMEEVIEYLSWSPLI